MLWAEHLYLHTFNQSITQHFDVQVCLAIMLFWLREATEVVLTKFYKKLDIRTRDSRKWQGRKIWDYKRDRMSSEVVGTVHINLHPECKLPCSNDFRDKQEVLKLMAGARGPYVPSTGNVISATVGLVYINSQPEYELPSSTRFGQFQNFAKIGLGTLSLYPPPTENISA